MTRWEDRRGRTKTLEREAGEGIQKYGETSGNQQYPDEPKRGSPQQRCLNMPAADPPRHVTCYDSRSNNEEYCRADNGEYSPHSGILHVGWRVVGNPSLIRLRKDCAFIQDLLRSIHTSRLHVTEIGVESPSGEDQLIRFARSGVSASEAATQRPSVYSSAAGEFCEASNRTHYPGFATD